MIISIKKLTGILSRTEARKNLSEAMIDPIRRMMNNGLYGACKKCGMEFQEAVDENSHSETECYINYVMSQ